MKSRDKYSTDQENFIYGEIEKKSSNTKQDNEFFKEEDYIPGDCVNVKYIRDNWVVYKNNKEYLVIKGSRFSSLERNYLKTKEGMQFLINGTKEGWGSISEFSRQIKKII